MLLKLEQWIQIWKGTITYLQVKSTRGWMHVLYLVVFVLVSWNYLYLQKAGTVNCPLWASMINTCITKLHTQKSPGFFLDPLWKLSKPPSCSGACEGAGPSDAGCSCKPCHGESRYCPDLCLNLYYVHHCSHDNPLFFLLLSLSFFFFVAHHNKTGRNNLFLCGVGDTFSAMWRLLQ